MGMPELFALTVGTGISVFLLFMGIIAIMQRGRHPIERLQSFVGYGQADVDEQKGRGLLSTLDSLIERVGIGAAISRDLAQADIKLTVTEFILIHVALVASGLLIGPLLLGSAGGGILVGVLLLFLPRLYVSSAQRKRQQVFAEQLPGALNSLSNSLRGGYGLVQAMALVGNEMGPPISTEFQRVVSEVGYGLPYDLAFKNMLRRNPNTDLSMVISAIEVNLEVGGNLSEILDNISTIIRDRVRIQGQIRAYTAQTRASSMVLTLLPFGLGALMYIVNREYISLLWTTSLGRILLLVAGVMLMIGSYMLQKISKIDV